VTVLASELIREAEKLIDMRIHPQTIIAGWRKATQVPCLSSKKYQKNLVFGTRKL
jgi:chaperonin GroEL (HSP60 family)